MIYIKEISNAFSNEFCKEVISNRIKEKRPAYEDVVYWEDKEENKHLEPLFLYLKKTMNPFIQDFLEQYNNILDPKDISLQGIGIIRQHKGVYDNLHYDTQIQKRDNGDIVIRPFVCLIYLNNDFEGGELIFPIQKKIVKPEAGKITIFPMSYMFPHHVLQIIKGERFFIRLNWKMADSLIDEDVNNWDVDKQGIMAY